MARRRQAEEQAAEQNPAEQTVPQPAAQEPKSEQPEQLPAASPHAAIQAPPKEGHAYTIDQRVGYRKEVSPKDGKLQIRFAQRPDGSRPDDELLEPVRGKQPDVKWADREKAWQAQTPEGADALAAADQKLAEIGRKRTGGHER